MKWASAFTLLCSVCAAAGFPADAPLNGKGDDPRALYLRDSLLRRETVLREAMRDEARRNRAKAARLNQYDDDCVAYDPGAGACALTVAEFNDRVEGRYYPAQDSAPGAPAPDEVEALRGETAREILEEKFLTARPLPAATEDSLEARWRENERDQARRYRARAGDSALRAAYRANPGLFQGGEERTYRVLVSSDSGWIDSVWRASAAESKPAAADSAGGAGARPACPPRWQTLTSSDLPANAREAAKGLLPGGLAGPLRVPFGSMIVRLASRRNVPATRFEEALPLLAALASLPPETDAALDKAVEDYFREHDGTLFAPDTVRLRAWLLADACPARLSTGRERERMRQDTARIRPVAMGMEDLPPPMQNELGYYRPLRAGELLGPIRSVFGTWYLRVLEDRPGRRFPSAEEARPAILKILRGGAPKDRAAQAMAVSRSKYLDYRKGAAARSMRERGMDGGEWMRKELVLRYVELPPAVRRPP